MEIVVDRRKGYAVVMTKKGTGIIIGTAEDVDQADSTEVAEMVLSALVIHEYEQLGTRGVYVVH